MPIKIDLDFAFDGNTPLEVKQAIREINSGRFKSNNDYRREALDLGKISDFFSGEGVASGLGLEGFLGFLGEPDRAAARSRGYINAASAPDAEMSIDTAKEAFGPKLAAEMEAAVAGIGIRGVGAGQNVTAEIKQTMTLDKKAETLTGKVLQDSRDIKSIERVIKSSRSKYGDANTLLDWLYTKADRKYREALFKIIDQKLANFIHIAYVDDKGPLAFPQAYIVTGAAQKLNLRNPSNGKRFLAPEFRNGSFNVRLNPAGMKFLESHGTDITQKIFARMSDNFGAKMLKFLFTDPKKKTRRAVKQLPKMQAFITKAASAKKPFTERVSEDRSVIIALAELIYFASQFDTKLGGKAFNIRSAQKDDVTKMGITASGIGLKEPTGAKQGAKQQLASEIQLTSLVQQAMTQRMAKGVPGGPPEPTPGRLTYRSGRYVKSVQVTRMTSKKLIYFKYDPIYRQWESEYNAETYIKQTIREVAQREFGKRFFVYREKNL